MNAELKRFAIILGLIVALIVVLVMIKSRHSPLPNGSSAAAPSVKGDHHLTKTNVSLSQNLVQQDREVDREHLRKIFDAIQAYKSKHGDLPTCLSDLYPDFLSDPALLRSPVEVRSHTSNLGGFEDPKMPTSYAYEYTTNMVNKTGEGGPMTAKARKIIQLEEYGAVTPLIRCRMYDPTINLSFSGQLYETEGVNWETDPNTLALMAKLGPGPGAKDARTMAFLVLDAATSKPLAGAEVTASNRVGAGLPLPSRTVKTDADGRCLINTGSPNPKTLDLRISLAGYAPERFKWTRGNLPAEASVQLTKAVPMGGVVQDPAGKPIADAVITISTVRRNQNGEYAEWEPEVVKSDAAGKWNHPSLPPEFKSLTFSLNRAGFQLVVYKVGTQSGSGGAEVTTASLTDLAAVMVMQPGNANEPVDGITGLTAATIEARMQVDLDGYFNAAFTDRWQRGTQALGDLPVGPLVLDGHAFHLQGILQLAGTGFSAMVPPYPAKVEGIKVGTRCAALQFLLGSGYGGSRGAEVAHFVIHLEGGTQVLLPIIYGQDVNDWCVLPRDIQEPDNAVWKHPHGGAVQRLYRTEWKNPDPAIKVESIDFISQMTRTAPFLLAVTAE